MPDSGIVNTIEPARIEPGGFRELGPLNWVIAKIGAKTIRAPRFTLFNVLGQHHLLFLTFLPYSGMLLGRSKLGLKDAELVILRVGHLRGSEYELQQHMVDELRARGMDMIHPPIVCFGRTSNDPHYVPAAEGSRPLEPGAIRSASRAR